MITAFITVRASSSRLPKKCFLPFGEASVLSHVITRAQHYDLAPIICTTDEKEDNGIAELAISREIPCFRGSSVNKLRRWRDCCREFAIDAFHSVDADDPFFCGEEVKRSFALLGEGYDMVAPNRLSALGGATVGYSLTADIVERACEGVAEHEDTEMMWPIVEQVPGIRKTTLSDPEEAPIGNRLTLDYQEDYVLLEAIRQILGNFASRLEIYELLERNPDLHRINAFRNEEWSTNQQNKIAQQAKLSTSG